MKKMISAILAAALTLTLCVLPASAKTISSARADNVFFYATNADGKAVLLKIVPLDELKALSHGQENGENYYISTTDNYPTTQYTEARGVTVNELMEYIKANTAVGGAEAVGFSGNDSIHLMATDGFGSYSRAWTFDQLYGVDRYYFEGLFDGWRLAWEIAGEDASKTGVTLEEYNKTYADSDPYYSEKRAVFEGGVKMPAILAVESYSGRTTGDTLTASTEPGIASYLAANGGVAAGSLRNALTDDYALRLCLPMTEADLMAAHRTAFDNFKWVYNLRLDMETAPALPSQGTVAQAVPSFSLDGDTLTVALTSATEGASIYYGFDGAPQTLYTGPFTVDVSGRELSANPVTVYAIAVQEGWDDAGMQTLKYPGMAPAFQTIYSGMTGNDLVFSAAEGVSAADWKVWTDSISFVTLKTPQAGGYSTVDAGQYTIDNTAKTITLNKSLFTETGSYSFIFHAAKYADKGTSVTMKQAAPELPATVRAVFGSPVTVPFASETYQSGLSAYVTPTGGSRTMISANYLDRTQPGQATIKAEYFALTSTAMPEAGIYILELVNNSFSPASQTVEVALDFSDVPSDVWYYPCVMDLASEGIISGIGSNLFDPEGTVTRGQMMKLLLLVAGYEEQAPTTGHWASGYMDAAAADGLIASGLSPDEAVTRLELCQTAAKVLSAQTTLSTSPFSDTDDPAVLALYELGIIEGIGNRIFSPQGTLTRSQISKVMWYMMKMEGEAT